MKITIRLGEDDYQLAADAGDGEVLEGEVVEYGLPAVVDVNGDKYMAYVEDPEAEDEELGQHVYKLQPIPAEDEEITEVEFEEDEEGDEEEDEDEGEELDEAGDQRPAA